MLFPACSPLPRASADTHADTDTPHHPSASVHPRSGRGSSWPSRHPRRFDLEKLNQALLREIFPSFSRSKPVPYVCRHACRSRSGRITKHTIHCLNCVARAHGVPWQGYAVSCYILGRGSMWTTYSLLLEAPPHRDMVYAKRTQLMYSVLFKRHGTEPSMSHGYIIYFLLYSTRRPDAECAKRAPHPLYQADATDADAAAFSVFFWVCSPCRALL